MSVATSEELFDARAMRTPPPLVLLSVVSAAMMCAAIAMVFFYAPLEKQMGFIQKIFYFHVSVAWTMFFSVLVMAVSSIGYLIKKTDAWDRWSDASVELAMLFGTLVLITGPLWGRKAWGVFWVWDVKLTATLILVLTLFACKIVRAYAGPSAKSIAAGLAVFSVLDTVFVYVSVMFWKTNHPPKITGQLDPLMAQTLYFTAITFLLTWSCLLWARLRMGALASGLDRIYMQATEAGLDD